MRRWIAGVLASVVAVAAVVWPSGDEVNAQVVPVLVRSYAELRPNGCLTYVSQWSDGSFQEVPWICSLPVVPLRSDRNVPVVRSYQERGREGCTWYVSLWADGVFTGVPFFCPVGAVPIKPGALPPAPGQVVPGVFPIPAQPIVPFQPVPVQPVV
ncbi:MAG: hypothetical protein NZ518_04615, partial [Dehalococcoidia bacterium]|nr:hypothetical protein [Dehalococcoidia bacterium]